MAKARRNTKDEEIESDKAVKVWDCGSPLYDSYELASVGHLIERHLMILPSLGGSKRFKVYQHQQINLTSTITVSSTISMKASEPRDGVVSGKFSGCMGSYSVWRKIKGERVKKISKSKKFRPPQSNWLM